MHSRFGEGPAAAKEPVQQLILDEHGRTLDLSGKEVTLIQHMPELKVCIGDRIIYVDIIWSLKCNLRLFVMAIK